MFDALNAAVAGAFGDPVIWRRDGVADASVSAIVDIEPLDEAGPGQAVAGSVGESWTLSVLASDLPGFDQKQHRFVVRGKVVKAAVKPFIDATGMMIISLEWVG